MAHLQRFAGIPMSKSMRDICKEEDYVFLSNLERPDPHSEEGSISEMDWRERREERAQRRLEREQQEQQRLRELERKKKEKEEQWRNHVAKLALEQKEMLKERALRLRDFRDFQKKVLLEELGLVPESTNKMADQALIRM
ncbi:MAP7 domain-containing protein 2 [Denticeps clupeoides]|uniref:MAP7 domain-containing protein 2 n=1 Tax=Denticeps clupeoides TaxID=299321 RepID=UPI0010A53CF2|nr:MAP7 domain-containing protein 2-like [Denticeps clupeoides]